MLAALCVVPAGTFSGVSLAYVVEPAPLGPSVRAYPGVSRHGLSVPEKHCKNDQQRSFYKSQGNFRFCALYIVD